MIKNLRQYDEEIERLRLSATDAVILYRGQTNSEWKLKSSLERMGINEIGCKDYYWYIDKLKPLINPLIENKFTRKITSAGYPFDFKQYEAGSWSLPEMEYITYLRHHGFPTPMIDWTESHYIALFFACEDFATSETDGKIVVYNERLTGRIGGNDIPELRRIGKYVETDKRHFAQQSQYLIPIIYEDKWKFIPFQGVLDNDKNDYDFIELEIDKESKMSLIRGLRQMNINRYTMYLDEDSLIRNFADELSLDNN